MTDFEYIRAETIADAVRMLNEPGLTSRVLAGGTDLVVQLRRGEIAFDRVVDVDWIPELHVIDVSDRTITIGAAVTFSDILHHPLLASSVPLLVEACRYVGGVQVRNMATIGGNVANAAACADLAAVLVCLDAHALIVTTSGEQSVSVAEFLSNRACSPHDLIRAFEFAFPPDHARTVYLRVDRRQAMAIARVSLAACGALDEAGRISDVRLAPGAVFDYSRRVNEVEAMLISQKPSGTLFATAGKIMQDVFDVAAGERWSFAYKSQVLATLTERALNYIFRDSE
jgi:CO/xanthine dehydrogenase FAD-binding subunit